MIELESFIIKFFGFIAIIFVIIFGMGVYLSPNDLASCSVSPDVNSKNENCKKADAIVVISGGDTNARTARAVELYKHGWGDYLILSGAAADKSGPSNAQAMEKEALRLGVSSSAMYLEENSENTRQNAKLTYQVLKNKNINRVILVTSAYHQRRASIEFNRNYSKDIEIINAPLKEDKHWSKYWWLTPRGWSLATGEIVKIISIYTGAI